MTPQYEKFIDPLNSFFGDRDGDRAKAKGVLSRMKLAVEGYYRNASTRQQLKKLAPWQLDDIGLTVEQANIEAHKSFWEK